MIDPLLRTAVRISTFRDNVMLTGATGFLFERDGGLFCVTSRHVMTDPAAGHAPDRIELELHVDPENAADTVAFSILLYKDEKPLWRQGIDAGGEIDVAVLALERGALPETLVYRAFTPAHLHPTKERIPIGANLLVVGYPLGFHDTLHRMPVARRASLASSWGLRFQGQGYFLTDARTHRGTSGAPVVMRAPEGGKDPLPWRLLGVHSSRLDMGTRDQNVDEALGLNCAWYADILLTLTEPPPEA